jgi:hypothetical protein
LLSAVVTDSLALEQLYYEFDNRTTSDLIVEVIKHASGDP